MVDALHEAHRVLCADGLLMDARPDSRVLAHVDVATPRGARRVGVVATRREELANDRASDRAVATVLHEGLFRSVRAGRFWHSLRFSDLPGLRGYLRDHLRFSHRVRWSVDAATRRGLRREAFVLRRAVRYELLSRREGSAQR